MDNNGLWAVFLARFVGIVCSKLRRLGLLSLPSAASGESPRPLRNTARKSGRQSMQQRKGVSAYPTHRGEAKVA